MEPKFVELFIQQRPCQHAVSWRVQITALDQATIQGEAPKVEISDSVIAITAPSESSSAGDYSIIVVALLADTSQSSVSTTFTISVLPESDD